MNGQNTSGTSAVKLYRLWIIISHYIAGHLFVRTRPAPSGWASLRLPLNLWGEDTGSASASGQVWLIDRWIVTVVGHGFPSVSSDLLHNSIRSRRTLASSFNISSQIINCGKENRKHRSRKRIISIDSFELNHLEIRSPMTAAPLCPNASAYSLPKPAQKHTRFTWFMNISIR